MKLYIHTYGRVDKQETLRWFSPRLQEDTYLVVQDREFFRWEGARINKWPGVELLVLPPEIMTLSPTRQFILQHAVRNGHKKIAMMDDDIWFYHRRDEGVRLFASTLQDVENAFGEMEDHLTEYLHVGMSAREGNNNTETATSINTRMMRCLGYRPKEVLELGCCFDRIRTKQDFDMTLQLLRLGKPNLVMFNFAQGQTGGSQKKGGCSSYRTPQMMSEDARKLAELHPGFVKVVQKTTKGAWGGGTREDVTIAWKKAYASAGSPVHDQA